MYPVNPVRAELHSIWETVKKLPAGETYEHTIEKSELYRGQIMTYYAAFDKCDRVEDYKLAWAHFEEVFNLCQNSKL
jgi:hypothetical protein